MGLFFKDILMKKFILVFLFLTSTCFGELLLEPYVGYGFNTGGEVENQPIILDYQGVYAGGKVGLALNPIMVGLLYDFMWFDLKASSTVSPYSYTYPTEQSNIGAFVGAQLESGLRFWGEYLFYVKNDYSYGGFQNYDKGWGWGLGLGYAVSRNLAFNVQFRYLDLNEVPAYNWSNDVLAQEILFTLSLPVYPF